MSERIPLQFYSASREHSHVVSSLPLLCGDMELSINGVDTNATSDLLAALFNQNDTNSKIDVDELTASDRDAILAALHRRYWGDNIVSTMYCDQCDKKFDLSFKLSELQKHLENSEREWEVNHKLEVSIEGEATGLKIPRYSDESKLSAMSLQEARKALEEIVSQSNQEVQDVSVLEEFAPIIDIDMDAICPECGASHTASFDIQTYTMQRLINDRNQLLLEVHLIAAQYGWSLKEILDLDRSTRKVMCEMIDSRNIDSLGI